MGAFKWLPKGLLWEESNKSNWHMPLLREQRCHHRMIKYHIYVPQLAHREAQLEQVRAERDNHFVQEEEILAHMRLLSSEANHWKSRVVTETEEVLCRESAQVAQQATEAQKAMDQHYRARYLCQSNSAQAQSLAFKLQETQLSSIRHKRDSSSLRHKPSDKLKSRSNKQQH